ncbi:hypothetical protein CPC08DRAFT_650867, partial [Agrocybe pediades]
NDDQSLEPAIVRYHGVICSKMLPPMSRPPSRAAMVRQRPYIRQGITVTGLGTEYFSKCVQGMEQVYLAFVNTMSEGSMDEWNPSSYKDYLAIESHSRYFSKVPSTTVTAAVAFTSLEDPSGVLQSMEGDGFMHTADNVVEYRSRIVNQQTSTAQYKHISPQNFRVGDIVEVSIAFSAYPCANNKVKFVPKLEGILLLNQEHRDTAAILKMRDRVKKVPTLPNKKRKTLYPDEEQIEETNKRMALMNISDGRKEVNGSGDNMDTA